MKKINLSLATGMMVLGLASIPTAYGVAIVNEPNTKAVGHVMWHNEASIDPQQLINRSMPANSSSLFFIRRYDNDPERLSANIAVNDRFQVSLHPGNYTQVYSCSGINRLSAEPTELKSNDLLLESDSYDLKPDTTYFFYVDVDEQGNSVIQQVTEDSALDILKDKTYQSHQITRVVANCPTVIQPPVIEPVVIVAPPPPVVVAAPKVVTLAPPMQEEKVSIELNILFDNDKAIIKPQYMSEVKTVADFMQQYPDTMAVIEGHTDNTGSASYNEALSARRADAVKRMLVMQYGINSNRITSIGYGQSKPKASNATAMGRQENRRVVAVIQQR